MDVLMDDIAFVRGLVFFRDTLGEQTSVQMVILFLTVAQNEGITSFDLSVATRVPPGSVSRFVKVLSHYADKDGRIYGMGLVDTQTDRYNRRRLAVTLTAKGREVYQRYRTVLGLNGVL